MSSFSLGLSDPQVLMEACISNRLVKLKDPNLLQVISIASSLTFLGKLIKGYYIYVYRV